MLGAALVAVFALLTGFNDAAALVGIGLRVRGVRPTAAVALLVAAVVAVPALVGTTVAVTLATRLVSFPGPDAQTPLFVGIAAAILGTFVLAARGLPTSLTLALVGGTAGAGVGVGAPVDWVVVTTVLVLAAAAPLVGGLAALGLTRALATLPARGSAGRSLGWLHGGGFTATCLAYGANDGQKMLAVYAAVQGGDLARHATTPTVVALIAGCFLLGAALGLRRTGGALGGGITPTRPDSVVVTEVAGAGVVLGTAVLGSPVSMTQSLSGALVGTGLSYGTRRVRWHAVMRLARAWMLTLPVAFTGALLACSALSAAG